MKRPLTQRIVFAFALLCYGSALACGFGVVFYEPGTDQDPVRASLIASVVFFIGCGVVLHVIAKARLQGVLSGTGDHPE